jgi:hypothetical protein
MVISQKRRLAGWTGVLVLLSGLTLAACNLVLGIGDATHDPSLDDAGADAGFGDNCTTYCGIIGAACTGDNAEYLSTADCQAVCANFDPGQITDVSGDSLGCRIHVAQMAASNPAVLCPQAGPLASGSCNADPCHAFCELVADLCFVDGIYPYDGGADCQSSCATYPYLLSGVDAGAVDADVPPDAAIGDIALSSSNTLNCRLYHLESAYNPAVTDAPKIHCPHTAFDSPVCY